jgi:hypothetical protein
VDEVGGRGQERHVEWDFGCGGRGGWFSERTFGGAGGPEGSDTAALIEIVFRSGFGLGGIELGALVEVVREGFLGGLVCLPTAGPHGELGLRRSPGGMDQWRGGGLIDVGEDSVDGLRVGEECDEGEGSLAGWTDEGKHLVDPGQEGGPFGEPGGGGVGWLG